jgi:predicted nucleic acid-binding Zn ribbon protein
MHSSCSGETKIDEDRKARNGLYILLLLLLLLLLMLVVEVVLMRAASYV